MGEYVKKTNNPKMGRPKIEIQRKEFEKLCALQCTEEEIAGFYNCSVDTIERFCKREYGKTFAETYKTYSANGKMSLRRNQFKLSETNASMAIWLGKQYLGQIDGGLGNEGTEAISVNVTLSDTSKGKDDE